jgi:hypothetical protein
MWSTKPTWHPTIPKASFRMFLCVTCGSFAAKTRCLVLQNSYPFPQESKSVTFCWQNPSNKPFLFLQFTRNKYNVLTCYVTPGIMHYKVSNDQWKQTRRQMYCNIYQWNNRETLHRDQRCRALTHYRASAPSLNAGFLSKTITLQGKK